MESLKITKPDQHIISCLKEIPENPRGIIIAIHGFSSSKECATYQTLFRKMPAAGYGVIGIDLPGHGFEESASKAAKTASKRRNSTLPGNTLVCPCFTLRQASART